VSCSDVKLSGRPLSGGATCGPKSFLASFYPVHDEGGSLPTHWIATCATDLVDCKPEIESITLTCCVFDDYSYGSDVQPPK
jgi:hypothetical protein